MPERERISRQRSLQFLRDSGRVIGLDRDQNQIVRRLAGGGPIDRGDSLQARHGGGSPILDQEETAAAHRLHKRLPPDQSHFMARQV